MGTGGCTTINFSQSHRSRHLARQAYRVSQIKRCDNVFSTIYVRLTGTAPLT